MAESGRGELDVRQAEIRFVSVTVTRPRYPDGASATVKRMPRASAASQRREPAPRASAASQSGEPAPLCRIYQHK